jgi:hypothetical protein
MDKLTLHLTLQSTAFREALRRSIEEKAERTQEAVNSIIGRRQAATLRSLAELVGTTSHEDQHMVILYEVAKATGRYADARPEFTPSPRQPTLLSRIGQTQDTPTAAASLVELATGGVADWVEQQRQKASETTEALNRAAREIRDLETRVADRNEIAERLGVAERALADSESERKKLSGSVEELRQRLGARETPEKAEKPRRTNLMKQTGEPAHKGIYFNEGEEGRIYEIGFADDTGARRWKVIGPDLQEAIALRAELDGKPTQREEVAA